MTSLNGLLLTACVFACACSSKPASCPVPGGPVAGAADAHCTMTQATSAAACHPQAVDAGVPDGGTDDGGMDEGYPPTLYNAEGDDDDCKYHVKWTVSPVCQNSDVTFAVTVTKKTDSSPLSGANPRLEVFLGDTHPAPNTDQIATETTPGTYSVGPVRFDASGKWTVRFHFFEDCSDTTEDSPHGHAAFFVNVP